MALPLAGRRIVITRPRDQAEGLIAALQALGAEVHSFPVIDIAPLEDQSALQDLAARLPAAGLAFFVSANAVSHALTAIPRAIWPAGLRVATVGPGTAVALRQAGFDDVIVPVQRYDSEAVLDLPEFQAQAVTGLPVLVFRGDGGRELLADTLRERGARVELVTCYRRRRASLDAAPLHADFQAGKLDALVFSSSEGVRYFIDIVGTAGRDMLARLPVFVPHPRIGEEAARLGASRVVLTAAGDVGIAQTLSEHFERA